MKLMHRLSLRSSIIVLLVAILIVIAYLSRLSLLRRTRSAQQQEQETIATFKVLKGPFEVILEGPAEIQAAVTRQYSATASGTIQSLLPNGTIVKAGDIIVQLDQPRMLKEMRSLALRQADTHDEREKAISDLEEQVRNARIRVQKSEMELENFRAEQETQLTDKRSQRERDAADLALLRERLERKKKLVEEGLVPSHEVAAADAEVRAKEFQLERQTRELELAEARKDSDAMGKEASVSHAKALLASLEGSLEAEKRNTENILAMQAQQMALLQEQIDKAAVRAPSSGMIIYAGNPQPGTRVHEAYYFGEIADLSQVNAIYQAPQDRARLLKLKQPATVTIPSLQNLKLTAEVTEIAKTATDETSPLGEPTGLRTFRTALAIKNPKGASLRPGMSAQVRIILEKIPAAVWAPKESIFEREKRKIVYVKRDDSFRIVQVELGAENIDEVVITKGLQGGESIALRDLGKSNETASVSKP